VKPLACVECHGENGDGLGKIAKGMTPRPRNFACQEMIKDTPDGQLFWIIQYGSKGTGMMGFKTLKDEQIWQLVLYLRKFSS
jgi:mono/diheme cytochrome c family protein